MSSLWSHRWRMSRIKRKVEKGVAKSKRDNEFLRAKYEAVEAQLGLVDEGVGLFLEESRLVGKVRAAEMAFEVIRRAKEEAWSEGHAAGWDNFLFMSKPGKRQVNPYREVK